MNIRETTNLPIHYLFPRFIRFFTLTIAILLLFYAVYAIAFRTYSDSSTIKKLFPFAILLFTLDSLYKNLFMLHTVSFYKDFLQLSFLAQKKIVIPYADMVKIDTNPQNKRYFYIHYTQQGIAKQFLFQMSYPNVIDILNFIKIFAPQIETDELISSLIFIPRDYTDTPEP